MIIHVVKAGETINSIADNYKVTADSLIIENGILNPNDLVVGQTIVIVYPLISYTVKEGDTLEGIAEQHNISLMQLLRNNPYLSDRTFIYPGEVLIIQYDTNISRSIETNGFAFSFINSDMLRKTLPYLTYLTIFNYRIVAEGEIVDIDDQDLVNMAKDYGVAPMMLVSTQTDKGISSFEIANTLLNNDEIQDKLIENIVNMLKRKGYYGLNQYFQFFNSEREDKYINYIQRLSTRLKNEGFKLMITITPKIELNGLGISYEKNDYSNIIQYADDLLFLTYNWGYSYGPPAFTTPINLLEEEINNIITTISTEKISIGLSVIGNDWLLPYVPGYSKANAITTDTAITIAAVNKVPIQYNEIAQSPYYFYNKTESELHNVWFTDARRIDKFTELVPKYELKGIAIWNIMYFFTQLWFIINNEYEIEKIKDL